MIHTMYALKQTFIAFLIVTILAPGFYFGVAPEKEAHAQDIGMAEIVGQLVTGSIIATSACMAGHFLQSAIHWAVDKIRAFVDRVAGNFFKHVLGGLSSIFGGIFDGLGFFITTEFCPLP